MNILSRQYFIHFGICIPDLAQVLCHNILIPRELLIPLVTNLRRQILQIILFRYHASGCPLICIIIMAMIIFFKNIGTVCLHCFPQKLQQYLQSLIRSFLSECNTDRLIHCCFHFMVIHRGFPVPGMPTVNSDLHAQHSAIVFHQGILDTEIRFYYRIVIFPFLKIAGSELLIIADTAGSGIPL